MVDPSLDGYFRARAELADHRNLFAVKDQSAPRDFRPLGIDPIDRVVPANFATVRAFAVHSGWMFRRRSNPHECYTHVVAGDGTLCPQLISPGRTLTDGQTQRLVALLSGRDPGWHVATGPDDPPLRNASHGFVFFEESGAPIASISVAVDFALLMPTPPPRDTRRIVLGPDRRSELRNLVAELGLARPEDTEDVALVDKQREADHGATTARWLPTASGLDLELTLDQTTRADRRVACAWHMVVWSTEDASPHSAAPPSEPLICDERLAIENLDWDRCRDEFPECSATIGQVEACMRAQRFDPCFAKFPACQKLLDCFWGMRAVKLPHG